MVMNIASAISAYAKTGGGGSMLDQASTGDANHAGNGGSFLDSLKQFAGDTVQSLKDSEQATAAGALGKANLQDVVMAVNKAEMMLTTGIALRDKVISAYQDIIKMPI